MAGHEPAWWYGTTIANRAAALGLTPIAAIYGAVAQRRLSQPPRYKSRLPVICVGNFTAGGAGKTPFVQTLVELLRRRGEVSVVLSRGYGGRLSGPHWVDAHTDTARDVGDEPLLLAAHAPVVVARDRAKGACAIEHGRPDQHSASVIVMDDGIQNPALAKSLVIAVIDASRGVGNGRCIPAGPLRAPLAAQLQRADVLVLNTGSGAVASPLEAVTRNFSGPVLHASIAPVGDLAWLRGAPVIAFAGIGVPQRFFTTVAAAGAELRECVAFGDHHVFAAADAMRLLQLARTHRATLITTEKDFARLEPAAGSLADLRANTRTLPIRMALAAADLEKLEQLIAARLQVR